MRWAASLAVDNPTFHCIRIGAVDQANVGCGSTVSREGRVVDARCETVALLRCKNVGHSRSRELGRCHPRTFRPYAVLDLSKYHSRFELPLLCQVTLA